MLNLGRQLRRVVWSGSSSESKDLEHADNEYKNNEYSITKPGEEKPNFEFRDHPLKPTSLWENSY